MQCFFFSDGKSLTGMAQLHDSFASLHSALVDEDYEEALSVSNKILSLQVGDEDALKCKVVSLIQLDRFTDVIQELEKEPGECGYELSYALYREKKHEEALRVLEGHDETNWLELKAQVSLCCTLLTLGSLRT